MKNRLFILLIIALCSVQTLLAQYEIKLEIKDCKDSCLILGHYYRDKTYAIDTAWNKKGKFVFKKKDGRLESGKIPPPYEVDLLLAILQPTTFT